MFVGEKFLPTIGKYAASNLGVIKTDLEPLFSWLGSDGLAIFTQMEQKFSADLPSAMGAFDNGIELLIKILGYASAAVGTLHRQRLDAFFTKWNTPGDDRHLGRAHRSC